MINFIFNEGFIFLVIMAVYYIKFPEKLTVSKIRWKRLGSKYGEITETSTGHLVRSKGEQRIADWLTHHGIEYQYEPKLFGLRPDFFIPSQKTVIEYWGMVGLNNKDGNDYRKHMVKKRTIYAKHEINLIDITPKEINSLDDKLSILIKNKPFVF